ncbi:MAG: hypothetical protein ACFFD2_07495 [Promethearchaeota archaeon]
MGKKEVKDILGADVNQPFIIELIVGLSMIVAPIILMINTGVFDPTLATSIVSGILIVVYAFYYYYQRKNQAAQGTNAEDYSAELNIQMNETFIIQMIFGAVMAVAGLIGLITIAIDINSIMVTISGFLLIVYSLVFYIRKKNLMILGEKGAEDFDIEVRAKVKETFIIQLIFGIAMVVAPLITMISYGFNMNLLMTVISGALLIVYSIYYYRVLKQIK